MKIGASALLLPLLVLAGCDTAEKPSANGDTPAAPGLASPGASASGDRSESTSTDRVAEAPKPGTPPPLDARGNAPAGSMPQGMPKANVSDETFAKLEKDVAAIEKKGDAKATAAAKVQLGEAIMQTNRPPRKMYPAALAEFRAALKLDPDNEKAKQWVGMIESIYQGMKRDIPK